MISRRLAPAQQTLTAAAALQSEKVEPSAFEDAFGASKDQLPVLIETKTVTISRLMELVPSGTADPTPFVYDKALYASAALQGMSFITNQFLRPVSASKHMKDEDDDAAKSAANPAQ